MRVVHGAWPATTPEQIVVAPFMFGAADMQASSESGSGGGLGFLARRQQRLAARQLSSDESMAERFTEALVRDLQQHGLNAKRLNQGESLPARGWLVRGSFVELDDPKSSDHVNIPLFGSGNTGEVGLWVSVDDLADEVRPVFEVSTVGAGAGRPGGVPSPMTAPIKIVLTQAELSQDAEELAAKISSAVADAAAARGAGR